MLAEAAEEMTVQANITPQSIFIGAVKPVI